MPVIGRSPSVTVVPLDQAGITPDPDNARRHTPRNIGVIENSMSDAIPAISTERFTTSDTSSESVLLREISRDDCKTNDESSFTTIALRPSSSRRTS
jgi:hypothetical protein